MAKQGETPGVEFIDDPHAPEVFAGEAVGFFLNAGIIRSEGSNRAAPLPSLRPGPCITRARICSPPDPQLDEKFHQSTEVETTLTTPLGKLPPAEVTPSLLTG